MRSIRLSVLAPIAFAVPAEAWTGAGGAPAWRRANGHPYAAAGLTVTDRPGVAAGRGEDLGPAHARLSHPRVRAPRAGDEVHRSARRARAEQLRPGAELLPYHSDAPPSGV